MRNVDPKESIRPKSAINTRTERPSTLSAAIAKRKDASESFDDAEPSRADTKATIAPLNYFWTIPELQL
ncbi:hypothetical protein TMatcc_003259 [Talaromyces marneffei ATCC 18224]